MDWRLIRKTRFEIRPIRGVTEGIKQKYKSNDRLVGTDVMAVKTEL
jgi:hypothetical protein